jgi:pimeloyl-ACP methyl ester carboxylesterase
MLEVILACIDQLTAGEHFNLIGISLGAYLARGVRLFRAAQMDGMALIIPAIIAEDAKRTVPPYKVLVEEPAVKAEITPAKMDSYNMAVVHTRKWLDYQRAFPEVSEQERGDDHFLATLREQPHKYAFSFDVDEVPQPFPGPALIITGRQDVNVGYRDAWHIVEKYPRATFVVFDRAGHELEEKENLVKALINEWLDRVEEYTGLR